VDAKNGKRCSADLPFSRMVLKKVSRRPFTRQFTICDSIAKRATIRRTHVCTHNDNDAHG
jgi:hypothetical protein